MIDHLVCILAGHTRTRIAKAVSADRAFKAQTLQPSRVVDNAATGALESAIAGALEGLDQTRSAIAYCGIGHGASLRAGPLLTRPGLPRLIKFGVASGPNTEVIPQVTQAQGVSAERLLVALAAHRYSRQACVVIDAGSAISVDYVDAYGVHQGGVVAPGLNAMAKAYAEVTGIPTGEVLGAAKIVLSTPLGHTMQEAIQLGCQTGVRGLVRRQLELVAEHTGVYPRVVATGDDAVLLFEDDDVIENIVPDLAMLGLLEAFRIITGVATPDDGVATAATELQDDEVNEDDE